MGLFESVPSLQYYQPGVGWVPTAGLTIAAESKMTNPGTYHAYGDATLTGNSLSSASATFTAADVGDPIEVWYAGTTAAVLPPPQPVVGVEGTPAGIFCYPRWRLAGPTTYYVRLTYSGEGGETTGSTEQTVTCAAGTVLEIYSPPTSPGAQDWHVYASTTSGAEVQQDTYTLQIGQPWFEGQTGLLTGTASVPASNTTSWNPPLVTTIATYINSHDVTLTASAGNSVSNANFEYGVDETSAINAALTACGNAGGGIVTIAGQYVVASGNIVIPNSCALNGPNSTFGNQTTKNQGILNSVPALILNPSYTVQLNAASGLGSLGVFEFGIPMDNFTTRLAIDAISSFAGTGVSSNPSNASDGQIKNLYVVGFNQCISDVSSQRWNVENFWGQCENGIAVEHNHDYTHWRSLEMFNFYGANNSAFQSDYAVTSLAANGSNQIVATISSSNSVTAGDFVLFSGTQTNFPGLYARWTVSAVSGGSVTLSNSQYAPATTGTWASGSDTVVLTSMNSILVGQTVTGTNIGAGSTNTIAGVDFAANTIILANPTTGAGTNTSLSFSNGTYDTLCGTSGHPNCAVLNLNAGQSAGGIAYYCSDGGCNFERANAFGWNTCWWIDQTSTSDKVRNAAILDSSCDDKVDATETALMYTNSAAAFPFYPGSVFATGLGVTTGYGTAYLMDAGTSSSGVTGGALLFSNANFSPQPGTELVGTSISGVTEFASARVDDATATFLDVLSSAQEVHLASFSAPDMTIIPSQSGQSNVYVSGDSTFLSGGPGLNVVQLFTASGTWTKPARLNYADIDGCGGGGGGGSGAAIASGTASSGGAGGGGGGCFPSHLRFAAADLGATETVTIGAAGTAGASVTSGPGNAGGVGGETTFGAHAGAEGGGGGYGGQSAAASGGGGGGIGAMARAANGVAAGNTGTTTGGSGGMEQMNLNVSSNYGNGGAGGNGNGSPIPAQGGGGAGGTSGAAGSSGGSTLYACGGGASGAGLATSPAALDGGTGGTAWGALNGGNSAKGPQGGAGAGTAPTPGLAYVAASGSSGGASAASGAAFAGGNGVQCGGGGGGGSALSGSASGIGGTGGAGWLAVWMAF